MPAGRRRNMKYLIHGFSWRPCWPGFIFCIPRTGRRTRKFPKLREENKDLPQLRIDSRGCEKTPGLESELGRLRKDNEDLPPVAR